MLQITSSINLNILLENLLFLVISTSFLAFVGFLWRTSKPFSLPEPLPSWFSAWLAVVLVIGLALPFVVMIVWGLWWGNRSVLQALIPYFVMLALQILSEQVTLRQFQSCVWVLIPCLYLPYRFWQLYSGLALVSVDHELIWVQRLLAVELVLWIFNYGVHLSQIPRLLRWEVQPQGDH